jgi:hypothetical protein
VGICAIVADDAANSKMKAKAAPQALLDMWISPRFSGKAAYATPPSNACKTRL